MFLLKLLFLQLIRRFKVHIAFVSRNSELVYFVKYTVPCQSRHKMVSIVCCKINWKYLHQVFLMVAYLLHSMTQLLLISIGPLHREQ